VKVVKKMTRRSFLKKGAAAAGALSVSGPLLLLPKKGQAAADKGPIIFSTYGGAYGENMQKSVIDPFIKKTGIQVIRTSTPRYAKVKAMVDTGNVEWDVVDAEARVYYRGQKIGLFVPLDWDLIGQKDNLVPGGAETHGAANVFFAGVLAWRKEKFGQDNHPKGWADFFSFPGKRSTRGEAYATFEIALTGDGVPKDQLYPLDVERALRKLSTVKKDIIFWANTKMAINLLVSKETDFGYVGAGPVRKAIQAGEPLAYTWNQATVGQDFLVIPKGSKQVEAAMKFIAYSMDPETQGRFSTNYNIGPSNVKAFDFMTAERREVLCTSPSIRPLVIFRSGQYWAEHGEANAKRFEQWLTSG